MIALFFWKYFLIDNYFYKNTFHLKVKVKVILKKGKVVIRAILTLIEKRKLIIMYDCFVLALKSHNFRRIPSLSEITS